MTQMPPFVIEAASADEALAILSLYQTVSQNGGGLARRAHEMDLDYVEAFLKPSLSKGIALVVRGPSGLLGEIHAYPPTPQQFSHVLSDLTLAIAPEAQGQGLGRQLMNALVAQARTMPHIKRIELLCRQTNHRGIALYQALGFTLEGRLHQRVYDPLTGYEDDLFWGLWL